MKHTSLFLFGSLTAASASACLICSSEAKTAAEHFDLTPRLTLTLFLLPLCIAFAACFAVLLLKLLLKAAYEPSKRAKTAFCIVAVLLFLLHLAAVLSYFSVVSILSPTLAAGVLTARYVSSVLVGLLLALSI